SSTAPPRWFGQHSKPSRFRRTCRSGFRDLGGRLPPDVSVRQRTTTTAAPAGGIRYEAIRQAEARGRTPPVPTTSAVTGSVTAPPLAASTRCQPAGTTTCTPFAEIVCPGAATTSAAARTAADLMIAVRAGPTGRSV